ncbi:MAG: DUF2723 domain-containing protein [Anaerolineae bacterium]|nr:DUF2723 domain-containing protein [Anaerolineae bacterium]
MRLKTWQIASAALFAAMLSVYVSHLAPSVVPGDPGEYQIIAARWGIGHPPGYGLYALLGNAFTHLVPVRSFAYRANLLSAVAGATIVALAYGIGLMLDDDRGATPLRDHAPAIIGALAVGAGLDVWQHAIHANAHVVTALLATVSLFCLLRWRRTARDRWLFAFCVVAGLSPVQHPLLVFAFPAYACFVIAVRPRIVCDWRRLLAMVGCAAIGLLAYLYYPLRSAIGAVPPPGPTDMHTWAGFVRIVTAQGLRVNLGGFSPRDILLRLWDVRVPIGLQYPWPALALAAWGLVGLWRQQWRAALLLTAYLGCVIAVTVNVLQDAMAYLLGPMVVIGVLVGYGLRSALAGLAGRLRARWGIAPIALAALLPLWSLALNWDRMDLSDFRDADQWLTDVEARFVGQGTGARLLIEWERTTTVHYAAAVEGRSWSDEDLRFVHVHAGTETPFLDAVEAHIGEGPVYTTAYRPEVAERYRLLPTGNLWQVLRAWPSTLPSGARATEISAEGRFEIVGWQLSQQEVQAGGTLLLDLYMRMPAPDGIEAQRYYLPWARLGERTYRFTTDRRFNTPWWQAGEIVVERFELPVPWAMPAGEHALQVGVRLINEGRDLTLGDGDPLTPLALVSVTPADHAPCDGALRDALGNLSGEILLRAARINGRAVAPEGGDLGVEPGERLRVVLEWEALQPVQENYKVFVQLLDMGLQIRAQGDDKAPLRGSAPTLLWFPRWRRGMRLADSYELDLPGDLAPGRYALVTGMYGFTTFRRVQTVTAGGDLEGDWITLGHLRVD